MARDHRGFVFVSVGRKLRQCISIEEAEASAVLMGLAELAKYYIGPIILEMDCSAVGRVLRSEETCRSSCFDVLADIKQVLAAFSKVDISIVSRLENTLAHKIAATARRSSDHTMVADVHANVRQQMIAECNPTIA